MKQIILCIGCGERSGCRISGVEKLCIQCKRVPTCYLNDCSTPTTESFYTCTSCSQKAERLPYLDGLA